MRGLNIKIGEKRAAKRFKGINGLNSHVEMGKYAANRAYLIRARIGHYLKHAF